MCSTRISNELGAGNSRAAHIVVYAAMSLAVIDALIVSMSLLIGRNLFGHIFSSDKETIDYVAKMAPLVSISLMLDALQGVLSGLRLVLLSLLTHKFLSDIVYSFPPHSAKTLHVLCFVLCQKLSQKYTLFYHA